MLLLLYRCCCCYIVSALPLFNLISSPPLLRKRRRNPFEPVSLSFVRHLPQVAFWAGPPTQNEAASQARSCFCSHYCCLDEDAKLISLSRTHSSSPLSHSTSSEEHVLLCVRERLFLLLLWILPPGSWSASDNLLAISTYVAATSAITNFTTSYMLN